MKRLCKTEKFNVGDNVRWKRDQELDNSVYQVIQILNNGNLFIDNGISSYTDVKPNSLELV